MALDPDAEQVLEMVRASGRPPYETLSPAEARALFLAGREVLALDPAPVAVLRDITGPNGVPLRLYRGRRDGFRRDAAHPRLLPRRRLGHRRPRQP
jgi:acetyl esterase